jgi:hypothetical protein
MTLILDIDRGNRVAAFLHRSFTTIGIHGRTDMPEDRPPQGVRLGSLEHILFLTLTVAIDYQRDASQLWESSRRSFEDPTTRYLFTPQALHENTFDKIIKDMQKWGLSKKPRSDAFIWKTVGVTFYKKWDGDPRNFLEDCGWDGLTILHRLRSDTHLAGNRIALDFPFLRGPKIGPLWLRMLRDNARITSLKNLGRVPIPVDIHVARATLSLGIVRGNFEGSFDDLFSSIRSVWFGGVQGLSTGERPMIALDVDEPLWHLSKYGCSNRDSETGLCPHHASCIMRDECVPGKILLTKGRAVVRT